MTDLLESLAAELERPREISAQVVNHVIGTYGLTREEVGPFLVNEVPKLEDWQVDLVLAPLFTPSLNDQAVFAELLGRNSIPATQWPSIIQQLTSRPTRAQLLTEDGQTHSVPLREVTIERYVHRLRLDAEIPESLFNLLGQLLPAGDHPKLNAIARRAAWNSEARRDILVQYLTSAAESNAYRLEDAVELLKLVETYQPADAAELLASIPHWQQVLRQEIGEASNPKPFFNDRVQDLHGGGRDQRRQDNSRIVAKENERAFLERLQLVLAG